MTYSTIKYRSNKPVNPITGDIYFDYATDQMFVWHGSSWIVISSQVVPTPRDLAPTVEQLDKHPSLKNAWEEYLIVKKLLGI